MTNPIRRFLSFPSRPAITLAALLAAAALPATAAGAQDQDTDLGPPAGL